MNWKFLNFSSETFKSRTLNELEILITKVFDVDSFWKSSMKLSNSSRWQCCDAQIFKFSNVSRRRKTFNNRHCDLSNTTNDFIWHKWNNNINEKIKITRSKFCNQFEKMIVILCIQISIVRSKNLNMNYTHNSQTSMHLNVLVLNKQQKLTWLDNVIIDANSNLLSVYKFQFCCFELKISCFTFFF